MWVVEGEAEGKKEVETDLRAGKHPQRRLLSRVGEGALREGRLRLPSE